MTFSVQNLSPANLGRRFWIGLVATLVVIVVVIAAYMAYERVTYKTYTAYFTEVNGLYAGDPVKVIGVDVGSVASITPRSDDVKVEFHVDRDVKVPANASAVIVAQSLVSGRFIQLNPVFDTGPEMTAGSSIPMDRTAVPSSGIRSRRS